MNTAKITNKEIREEAEELLMTYPKIRDEDRLTWISDHCVVLNSHEIWSGDDNHVWTTAHLQCGDNHYVGWGMRHSDLTHRIQIQDCGIHVAAAKYMFAFLSRLDVMWVVTTRETDETQ